MFYRSLLLLILAGLMGCASINQVTLNGTSIHVTNTDRNKANYGIGVVTPSDYEIGIYRNSSKMTAYSPYITKRLWKKNNYFVDVGGVYYPNVKDKDDHLYLRPVLRAGKVFWVTNRVGVELGVAPKDLITGRLIINLDSSHK